MVRLEVLLNTRLFTALMLLSVTSSHLQGDISDAHIFLERGTYMMGSYRKDLAKSGEFPAKHIQVKPFAIDQYPITNSDFKVFKKEKPNYITDAELEGYSWVIGNHKSFRAEVREDLKHPENKHWKAVMNATWYQPYGLGSNIEGKDSYPVIHVSFHDAHAFCQWAGKRVTSEYEWEYAARGGEPGNRFPWGNSSDYTRANLWQGRFPDFNYAKDGYERVSPVDAFEPQNDYGMYDMLGNVWEWTSTVFTIRNFEYDRSNPTFSVRGTSFIDSFDGRINEEARISNRKGLNQTYRAENLGFRCAYFWKPGQPTTKLYRPRPPVHHRLEDTWEYKAKKVLKDAMGSVHKTEEL